MLGVLVILILSWLLLHFLEGKNLLVLGFLPVGKRLRQFLLGFFITAALGTGVQLLEGWLSEASWRLSDNYSAALIVRMGWWDLRSILTEELIFRGALLYLLIQRLGARTGILISAVAFGIFHWFSFDILGQWIPMLLIFIGTGLMGYAWGRAFHKTGSILMPIGFHLGWNFTLHTLFSRGPLGEGLLLLNGGHRISDWYSLLGLWLVPLIVLLIVNYGIRKENSSAG